jgi:hypothetical protein
MVAAFARIEAKGGDQGDGLDALVPLIHVRPYSEHEPKATASTQLRRAPWRSPVLVSEVFKGARSAGASHWWAASVKDARAGDRAVEATAGAGLVLFDRQYLLATIENLEALKQDVERPNRGHRSLAMPDKGTQREVGLFESAISLVFGVCEGPRRLISNPSAPIGNSLGCPDRRAWHGRHFSELRRRPTPRRDV